MGGSKITIDGDCSHEIKRCLLLGRKVMTNVDSMLKNKDITLPTKVHLVKALIFPIVTYGCESWTIKKAERRRIDAFELWCWRRLLRIPWTARKSNQSILKEINPEYSLEGQPRQHIKKQRHYFADKAHLVKAMVFPVVLYGCESWTIKKAEHRRIYAFELWCWISLQTKGL